MTEVFISFNYFRRAQPLSFAIRKTFAASRENSAIRQCLPLIVAKQPHDCMQWIRIVEIVPIVTNVLPQLRTRRHLDGSHGVCDGG